MYSLFFIYIEKPERSFTVRKNTTYRNWLYLFVGGFLTGILLMNLGKISLLGEFGIFDTTSLERIQWMDIDSQGLLAYVLRQRLWELVVLLVLSTTTVGLFLVYACILWRGLLAGMVMSAAMIRFGIKGLLLIFGSAFPQQLLLFPAWFLLLGWCYENCCRLHFPEKGKTYYDRSKRRQLVKQGISLVWIFAVTGIGCILESYVNPMLLSDFLKFF